MKPLPETPILPKEKIKGSLFYKYRNGIAGYTFLSPALLAILFFILTPIIYAFIMMFFKVDLLSGDRTFIGFGNFEKILSDPKFWAAFHNTGRYVLFVVPIQTIIAMILAALINSKVKFSRVFLSIMFVPTLTSSAAMTLIFMWLFNNNGLIVNLIQSITGEKISFITNPDLALTVIMIMNIFSTIPHFMIVFLSGLQDIPD